MAGEWFVLVWILALMCWTQGEKVNIALRKPAWTTLGYLSTGWEPGKAVNGIRTSCFHGARGPSDWTVDLGQEFQLYDIRVYLRNGFESRTANSTIYLDNNSSSVCYTFPSTISDNPTDVTCNGTGQNVTIRNPGNGTGHDYALNICEVEIYGCSAGTYGRNCTESCGHCASPPCDRWTGVCDGDCAAGYRGNKCDTMCNNTTYGINCKEKCADRKCYTNTSTCDHVTGSCDTGCLPGWMGNVCTEECENKKYGSKCSNACADRHCYGNSSCHHVTGSCDNGCEAGWNGIDCKQACNSDHYGPGCVGVCSTRHCEGSSSCSPTTGQCDGGCQTGWTRIDCSACGNEYYGMNCSSLCTDRHCFGNTSCDNVTGSCDKGCEAGWKGAECRQECESGHYGRDCTGVCSTRHCEGGSSCNHITGQCDGGCQTGWTRTDCTDCDNQHYGNNCDSLCAERNCYSKSSCNHVTGLCDQGCVGGWKGFDCRQRLPCQDSMRSNSPPVPAIVGCVIGAVVLVLVLVLVIVLMRRRGKSNYKHGQPMSKASHDNRLKIEKGPSVYENVVLDDESRKPVEPAAIGLVQLNGQAGGASEDFDSRSVDTLEEEEDYDSPVHNIQQEEGRNYYNLDNIHKGHMIPVSQLEVRVREFEENTALSQDEFQQLPDTFLHPYDESQKPGNKSKNRFKGYYPYNYNRIVLHGIDGDGKDDYINASYLDGYNSQKRYIAAQGPYKEDIVEDFWRMIWQEGCQVVVMVTGLAEGGKMKCLRYWPEKGSSIFGDVTVTNETETTLADYTITKLAVQHGKESKKRHVTHFHFTSWPDHGVPDTSCLLQYMWRISSTSGQQKHPIVVHCSAGIGRTGTYIAVKSLVSQAMTEGTVDVVGFVSNMRSQRKNMIQTKEQYLFIYQAVMAAVVQGDTSLDADVIRQIDLGHVTDLQMGNKTVQQHLETMARYPETSTSENILRVSSYTSRAGFFVFMSQPDKEELWNQIYNSDSRTLVTWEPADKSYFPSSDQSMSTSRLTVSMRSLSVISNSVTLSKIHLKQEDDEEAMIMHYYHVTGSVRDPSVSVLIDSLLQWTGLGQPECESTTLISDSVSESRLLILLVNITSRLQDDGKVDVISNMRRLQSLLGGPRFTVDDVRLCLEYAQHRLESLGMYANL